MTYEEAIIELQTDKLCLMAIASHPSLVNVEEIGIAISAIEKQMPKKVEVIDKNYGIYTCPTCGESVRYMVYKYCCRCGQALDWSDTE